jgi:hypothetical protein
MDSNMPENVLKCIVHGVPYLKCHLVSFAVSTNSVEITCSLYIPFALFCFHVRACVRAV